jgi:hypothetical protein
MGTRNPGRDLPHTPLCSPPTRLHWPSVGCCHLVESSAQHRCTAAVP